MLPNFSGAFLKKVNFTDQLTSKLGKFIDTKINITDEIMKRLDVNSNGTGNLVLIRYLTLI